MEDKIKSHIELKLLLLLLLSTSFSTFALELDFWSSESFCYESPNVQNRNGVLYLPNQQEPFTGENLCVFTNGQHHSKGNVINGLGDGKWTWWYESGMNRQETIYKDGKKDGKQTAWYKKNGQINHEGSFKDGKKDGNWTYWKENGQIRSELNWKDGKKDGNWTYWKENGQIRSESNWKDGECISGDCV